VLVGDAPPKDPEPITGATLDQTVRRANLLGAPIHTMVVDENPETAAAFGSLSARTSGTSVSVDDPSQVAAAIVATLQRNAGAPSATTTRAVGGRGVRDTTAGEPIAAGYVGVPVRLSAAASNSPLGDSLTYAWSFGDGTVTTTDAPVIAHTWAQPYAGDVALTVVDSAGRSAIAVQPIAIVGGAPRTVASPTGVRLTPGPGRLDVRWARPRTGRPVAYEILDGSRILGVLYPPREERAYRKRLEPTIQCRPLRLRVVAVDGLGRRATSVTSRATVVRPRTTVVRRGSSRIVSGRCGVRR